MKRKITNKVYKTIEELKIKIVQIVKELLTKKFIENLCGFDYFFD